MKKRVEVKPDSKPGYFKLVINSNNMNLGTSSSQVGKYVALTGLTIDDLINIKMLLVRLELEKNGAKY